MKEMKLLKRLLGVFETVQTFVLSCCLSLPLVFIVPEFAETEQLLWGFALALAVLAVHLPCRFITKRLWMLAVALGVLALGLLICPTTLLRVFWGLCVGLQCFCCAVLPRPDSKIVLSVPKVYHAVALLLLYAFSRILRSDLISLAAVSLSALWVVNALLHWQAHRLLIALCDKSAPAVSDQSLIRLNRRLMGLFCALGAALVVAVPLLWSLRTPPVRVEEEYAGLTPTTVPSSESEALPDWTWQTRPAGKPLDYQPFIESAEIVLFALAVAVVVLAVVAIMLWLRNLRDDRELHSAPEKGAFTVETLAPAQPRRLDEPHSEARGWARRIRSVYQHLIRARTGSKAALHAMTPSELEQAGALKGEARDKLHALYEKARYSGEACDKPDYLAAKAAAQALRKDKPT